MTNANTTPTKQEITMRKPIKSSIIASIIATFLLRIASRTSFVLLGFYLGEHFESATLVVGVIEAFYITELLLAPIVGKFSDRVGRKPFLLYAPLLGIGAASCLAGAAFLFPKPDGDVFSPQTLALLLMVLVGRLLEGAVMALNTPASLGYLTDISAGSEKLRARVVTGFEVATVGGLALAIPFGGQVSKFLGTNGFFLVMALHAVTFLVISLFMHENFNRTTPDNSSQHGALRDSLKLLSHKRIFTFMPAWLAVNALVGALLTLIIIVLTYPITTAKVQHPNQLLYGGFSKDHATLLVGGFGLIFLLAMGGWSLIIPRLRRTTVMLVGLLGLVMSVASLTFINGLGENLDTVVSSSHPLTLVLLLALLIIGVALLSGFTPASLTHMGNLAETMPGKRGAVMGLYSVMLGLGQLLGAFVGGIWVDRFGFYGLMLFGVILGLIALISVLYMRIHNHDQNVTKASFAPNQNLKAGQLSNAA